ncbi:tetratricopeptide repeat protein [Lacinutrix sp. Hel_I_90]|uniref:tetratricopeptide repeat protein n=1 Tax=Lacinutrix sp. Hel_I_90 TaxID=1249999 RepID=UPI0005C9BF2F|nr:tetratricopeptide repeat protein [Lacinutrix sp. Hel_I_90]
MKKLSYIFLFICGLLSAQNEVVFDQANTLYNEGKFAEALDKYETILKGNQHSAELYFNIANAHYKLNHIAPSIYYYEKAAAMAPKDEEIMNNLAFANNMTIDAIENIPETSISKTLNKIKNVFSFDGWALLSVISVVLFVLLYLAYYFTFETGKKRLFFTGSVLSIFLTFTALAFTFHTYNVAKNNKPAIVFAQEAQVTSEPNSRSVEAFVLHEGTKVQVLDTVSHWKKIKLSDGKTGWIPETDIKLLNIF